MTDGRTIYVGYRVAFVGYRAPDGLREGDVKRLAVTTREALGQIDRLKGRSVVCVVVSVGHAAPVVAIALNELARERGLSSSGLLEEARSAVEHPDEIIQAVQVAVTPHLRNKE